MRWEIGQLTAVVAHRETRAGRWLLAAGALLVGLLALGVFAWRIGFRPQELAVFGYPGVFLVMLVSGAGTFFPAPSQAAVLAAGAMWNPLYVGMAAGLGNATGELLGYAAGRAGAAALNMPQRLGRLSFLHDWLSKYGFFAILAMALVPNPVFDIIGLLAGSLGYPARRFWIACALGNSIKYAVVARLGGFAMGWFG
jgi:membrane protein YqaA with SNARE-associated domain